MKSNKLNRKNLDEMTDMHISRKGTEKRVTIYNLMFPSHYKIIT